MPEPEEAPPLPESSLWRRLRYFLFIVPHGARTNGEIIRWWEKRRLAYNGIVGAFGMVTLLVVAAVFRGRAPLAPAVVIGIAANICYCAGWLGEIVLQRCFVRYGRHRIGSILMSAGLGFSVFVVLAPILLIALLAILRLIP